MKTISTNYVIDASAVAAFLLPDEIDSNYDQYLDSYSKGINELHAPTLIEYEIANIFKSAVLRKRIKVTETTKLLMNFERLEITLHFVPLNDVLTLALESNLSVYDASYLYLSQKMSCKLLTLDKRLQNIANI